MKRCKSLIALSALVGTIGFSGAMSRAENIIVKEESSPGSYCHLTFQAIQERTLASARPSLTTSGDLIDFYGSCDHDPLGREEVQAQRIESQHRFASDYEDENFGTRLRGDQIIVFSSEPLARISGNKPLIGESSLQ